MRALLGADRRGPAWKRADGARDLETIRRLYHLTQAERREHAHL